MDFFFQVKFKILIDGKITNGDEKGWLCKFDGGPGQGSMNQFLSVPPSTRSAMNCNLIIAQVMYFAT